MRVPAAELVTAPDHDYLLPELRLVVDLELDFITLKRVLRRFWGRIQDFIQGSIIVRNTTGSPLAILKVL